MELSKLSEFLKQKRIKTGISLNQFAFNIDMEPATPSRIENGKLSPTLLHIIKISKGLNILPLELLQEFEKTQCGKNISKMLN